MDTISKTEMQPGYSVTEALRPVVKERSILCVGLRLTTPRPPRSRLASFLSSESLALPSVPLTAALWGCRLLPSLPIFQQIFKGRWVVFFF